MSVRWNQHGESLAACLAQKARERGDDAFIHLLDDRGSETVLGYRELYAGSAACASALARRGVRAGDRIMIGLPTGRDFLNVFFGTLLLGAVAVPFYPPARQKGLDEYESALALQVAEVVPALVVTFSKVRMVVESATYRAGVKTPVMVPEALTGASQIPPSDVDPDAVALIQFTSGSTREPKGVVLTHRQILGNVAAIAEAVGLTTDDRVCSWLPLYHDMGLIGTLLTVLVVGTPIVLMSPLRFLMDTKTWLWTIHHYRCTLSTAPNFAYHLVAHRLKDQELAGLDLSCWRLAYCGAEPVQAATMAAFCARYEPYGFDPKAIAPIYGLAEMAVAVSFPTPGGGLRVDTVDAALLEQASRAIAPRDSSRRATTLVAVGRAIPGHAICIRDPEGQMLPERRVGEVCVAGPGQMNGYLNDSEASAAVKRDGWLQTGDLGYLVEGELYITGRLRDRIIKAGRNLVPHDIEYHASQVPGIRAGNVAAFGVPGPDSGTEAVVVLAETRSHMVHYPELADAIATRLRNAINLQPDRVVILPPGTIPKTSSGKIRRQNARERFLNDTLTSPANSSLTQATRRVGRALIQRITAQPQTGDTHASIAE